MYVRRGTPYPLGATWDGATGVNFATDDREVLTLRRRQQRNLLATLLLSQGTPMLGGDRPRRRPRTRRSERRHHGPHLPLVRNPG